MASTIIENINEGLRYLYQQRGLEYDDLFKTSCDDNGFEDDDTLEEELASEYTESQLTDDVFIDGLCEWIDGGGDEEQRQAEIFDIFQKLSKNPNYFQNNQNARAFRDSIDWSISEKDVVKSDQKVQEQAKDIYSKMKGKGGGHGDIDEAVLRNMLAVAHKDGSNYFQFLVDMYLRERVDYHYRNHQKDSTASSLEVSEWALSNKHMLSLKKKKTKWPGHDEQITCAQAATAAMTSYLNRVASKLLLPPSHRIKGDLLSTAMYIEQAAVFVHSNAMAKKETCPFQYDTVIAFKELEDEVDDYDDDNEDEDDEKDPDEIDDAASRMSRMGNVKQRLNATKLKCIALPMNVRKAQRTDEAYRLLKQLYKEETFPRHARFCSIMDFRDETPDGEPRGDNFFVFEANEGNNKVYPDASSLNYFNNGYTIIPPSNPDEDVTDKLGTLSDGPQIVLSFHVDDTDSIRCYIFVHGQWSRFQAKDLKLILPFFLEDSQRNRNTVQSERMEEIIAILEGTIKDKAFDSFLKRNGVKCPLEEEREKSEK